MLELMDEKLAAMARCFRALGYENRLELLSILSESRTLNDIDLGPANPRPGENADRVLTRQGIQYHLDQLLEQGLIQVEQHNPPGERLRRVYEIDRGRLFELTEQIQDQLLVRPSRAEEHDPTARPSGPYVAVVHGPARGRLITLVGHALANDRGWVIGRSEDAHIHLPIDDLVASQHAEILQGDDGFEVLDLRTSGRTEVNWAPIPLGGSQQLVSGDIIGVGHSLLVFCQPAPGASPLAGKVVEQGIPESPPVGL